VRHRHSVMVNRRGANRKTMLMFNLVLVASLLAQVL
jgi:hypothetical protein